MSSECSTNSFIHNKRLIERLDRFVGSFNTESPRGEAKRMEELCRVREDLEECDLCRPRETAHFRENRLAAVKRARASGEWQTELSTFCTPREIALLRDEATLCNANSFAHKEQVFLSGASDMLVKAESRTLRLYLEALHRNQCILDERLSALETA